MGKAVIQPMSQKDERITVRIKPELRQKLNQYVTFLEADSGIENLERDYVISECINHVLNKDKEFKKWLKNSDKTSDNVVDITEDKKEEKIDDKEEQKTA